MKQSDPEVFSEFVSVKTNKDERFYFIAAALTCGFNLAKNTPKITNTYSIDDTYERGQSGDVTLLLEARSKDGIPLPLFAKVWRDWDDSLQQATEIPKRILTADNPQKVMALIQGDDEWPGIDWLVFVSALAHMRLFTLRRVSLPDNHPVSEEETKAAEFIDGLAASFSDPTKNNKRMRTALAKGVKENWRAAMVAWIKAFTVNYLEIRDIWKEAPESIKISRGDGRLPLVIPKGPNFKKMLNDWT